ncbi:unnamed protein product [Sphagnum balticum]
MDHEEEGMKEESDEMVPEGVEARKLELEFAVKCKARTAAQSAFRVALWRAVQQQFMVKEQNRSPSAAMQISWACDKIIWSMLCEGKSFAEVEINKMVLHQTSMSQDLFCTPSLSYGIQDSWSRLHSTKEIPGDGCTKELWSCLTD